MDQVENCYQVVIVGAGTVGLSLAATLGMAGFSVAILEANEPVTDWPEQSVDLRVYAITRASQSLFESVGAWSDILPRACAYQKMQVWDQGGNGDIHFDSADLGEPYLGHIIEARVIDHALLSVVDALPGVTRYCPAQVESFADLGDYQQVQLEDSRVLAGQLLIGADGRNSRVRDYAGIHAQASDYGQQALVCVVKTEHPHEHTAWQRFLTTGPLAFLPLQDGQCSIVWSATTDEAQRLLQLDDKTFCDTLAPAFDYRLGDILQTGERVLFPLSRQHAADYVRPRIALVGDAAHVIHPLAGQGVNLGLKDVIGLADSLQVALQQQRDPGAFSVLRRYERARKGDNLAMMTAMDGFKHLFGSQATPLRLARNLGLNLVDAAAPLKHKIMRMAMGF